jgi:hypothetical protein
MPDESLLAQIAGGFASTTAGEEPPSSRERLTVFARRA